MLEDGTKFLFWKTWIWEVMQVDGTFLVCCQTTKRNRDHVGVRRVAKLTKANVWLYLFGVITAVALLPWSHWVVIFLFFESVLDWTSGPFRPWVTFSPCEDCEAPRRSWRWIFGRLRLSFSLECCSDAILCPWKNSMAL